MHRTAFSVSPGLSRNARGTTFGRHPLRSAYGYSEVLQIKLVAGPRNQRCLQPVSIRDGLLAARGQRQDAEFYEIIAAN